MYIEFQTKKSQRLLGCNPTLAFLNLEAIMTHPKARSQFDIMHPLFDAIADSDLTAPQAHLLITLFKFCDENGFCYPSYTTLLKYTKMSRPTLCKHIKSLVDNDWIAYKQGDKANHQSNSYLINLERLGFVEKKVVPINKKGFIAPDGSKWSCASEYHVNRNTH